MYHYKHLVLISSNVPLNQEVQIIQSINILKQRLHSEYSCPIIRQALELNEAEKDKIKDPCKD
jgi:hypothetical protein